jgi:hypothetical protein
MFYCPNPACEYGGIIDKEESEFNCFACKGKYCISCLEPVHHGESCEEAYNSKSRPAEEENIEQQME